VLLGAENEALEGGFAERVDRSQGPGDPKRADDRVGRLPRLVRPGIDPRHRPFRPEPDRAAPVAEGQLDPASREPIRARVSPDPAGFRVQTVDTTTRAEIDP